MTLQQLDRCLVFCRLRQSFARDFQDRADELLEMRNKEVVVKGDTNYPFDGVFDGSTIAIEYF